MMPAPFKHTRGRELRGYALAMTAVTLVLVLSQVLMPRIGAVGVHGLLLSSVVVSAWYGGRWPGIAAAVVAALAGSIQPVLAGLPSTVTAGEHLQLGVVLGAGVVLSVLVGTLHARLDAAQTALRARDDLLAIATHELKAPLTLVIGFAQTLQIRAAREGHLPRRDLDTLRVIVAQARRLDTLIDSVLDLSRLQHGQLQITRQEMDLVALARSVADDIALVSTRHPVTVYGPDTPVPIDGDPARLEQVLRNLLDNAVKYSPDGEPITVGVEQRQGEAVLTVNDRGIGIPAAACAKLFDRFYRAANVDPRRAQGTGIGLSVVAELVELHGGAVEVDSVEGQGSTFTIRLPLGRDIRAMQLAMRDRSQPVPQERRVERCVAEHAHQHAEG